MAPTTLPSIPYIEAYQDACEFGWSLRTRFCLPSLIDDSLAPEGAHVMSLFCQHFRRYLPNSMIGLMKKSRCRQIINTVEQYSPGFRLLANTEYGWG